MAIEADYIVVGSGLTGATIARSLVDRQQDVIVVERRDHLGGNVHDHRHVSGIRVHTYGPHYFRTNSRDIWSFVNRFAEFEPYEASIMSYVDGRLECWPVTESYLRRVVGETWTPDHHGTVKNFEEACLAMMPRSVYERFVRGYSEKQWGVRATDLDASLAGRFDVRRDDETRLSRHRFQGLPAAGYATFMAAMLAGVRTHLGVDFLTSREQLRARRRLIFTGAIDEFFGYDRGRLAYRAQRRQTEFIAHVDRIQPCGQVNYPNPADGSHIRQLEWKHMMSAAESDAVRGTVVTREYPYSPTDAGAYEYPFPDAVNRRLYADYRLRADALENVLFCGRLGEYRYLDMDQAIARARMLAGTLLDDRLK